MKKLITIAALFIMFKGMTQDNEKKDKITFQSINNIGMLAGEGKNAFQIQTVNGVKFKTFFAGIGLGIDEYHTRSIPLFLDIRKSWKKTGETPFIYLDAGTHFIWPKEKNEMVEYDNAGFFYDLGIGYRIPVKNNAVLLSAGYSYKTVKSEEQPYYYSPWVDYYSYNTTHYEYQLRRISLKVGFAF